MKKISLAALAAAMLIAISPAQAVVDHTSTSSVEINSKCQWIDGYYRKDGTYVRGHWRGCP